MTELPDHDGGMDASTPSHETAASGVDAATPGSAASSPEAEGPLSESDALRQLASGGVDDAERAEAARAARIADLITERLQGEASGLSIGTLALFHDTVSFGGGFNTAGRSSSLMPAGDGGLVRIEEDEQAEHIDDYIRPTCYENAFAVLLDRHLLVLASEPGTGREATAVNLLAETLAVSGAEAGGICHQVTNPAAVMAPDWRPPVQDSGYLVMLDEAGTSGTHALRAIDINWLTSMAARLRSARGFMVIVTGPPRGALARAADRSEYVLAEIGEVAPVTIIERRVLGHTSDPASVARLHRMLTESGALVALREQPSPGTAARLASAIRAGGDLPEEVAAIRDPSAQVHQWFIRHDEPAALCFALAAAVLEESSYLTVSDAALQLYAAVQPTAGPAPDIRFRDRLAHDQPWIEILRVPEGAGSPGVGSPEVRFRSPLVRQAVLAYAWTYLDGYRAVVLAWLRKLLTQPDLEVRARAAVAAGIIAWGDHRHAQNRYLRSWAGSQSWPVRQAAATALAVMAGRPELTEFVWSLLDEWVSDGSSPFERRLAKTSATAVGGLLGKQDPKRAMVVLRAALDWREDWGNLTPVAWSAVHLIDQGRAREVLTGLLEWSAPQDLSPMVSKTLSAFLFAARQPSAGDENPFAPGSPSRRRQPSLLRQARELQVELEELWARALARKPVQAQALLALEEWIDTHTGKDRTALAAIQDILIGIARRPGKHRQRILHYLGLWATDRDHPSRNAAELLPAVERAT